MTLNLFRNLSLSFFLFFPPPSPIASYHLLLLYLLVVVFVVFFVASSLLLVFSATSITPSHNPIPILFSTLISSSYSFSSSFFLSAAIEQQKRVQPAERRDRHRDWFICTRHPRERFPLFFPRLVLAVAVVVFPSSSPSSISPILFYCHLEFGSLSLSFSLGCAVPDKRVPVVTCPGIDFPLPPSLPLSQPSAPFPLSVVEQRRKPNVAWFVAFFFLFLIFLFIVARCKSPSPLLSLAPVAFA